MSDPIERQDVLNLIRKTHMPEEISVQFIYQGVKELPTIDAVPVVRCRDCKHKVTTEDGEYNPRDIVCDYWESDGLEETDFCSYGERRTDE